MLYTIIYNDNMGFKFSHLIATCLQTLYVFAWIFPYRMAMPSNDVEYNGISTLARIREEQFQNAFDTNTTITKW